MQLVHFSKNFQRLLRNDSLVLGPWSWMHLDVIQTNKANPLYINKAFVRILVEDSLSWKLTWNPQVEFSSKHL